jgi:hypothetical protein
MYYTNNLALGSGSGGGGGRRLFTVACVTLHDRSREKKEKTVESVSNTSCKDESIKDRLH